MEFIEARWKTVTSGRRIRLLVIHTMQAPERATTAEAVARWFATTDKKVSAHKNFDNNSAVQCVRDKDVAYAAPGANHDGMHYELSGYAEQTREQWSDQFSDAMLARVAIEAHRDCEKYALPVAFLDKAAVLSGRAGITTHHVISQAYKKSNHWDPGPHFPMALFLDMVKAVPLLGQPKAEGRIIMNDCVDAVRCPVDGGLQKLQADGGIFNDGCDHFHGSYPGLNIDAGNKRLFKSMVRLGTTGYTLVATTGETYDFPG